MVQFNTVFAAALAISVVSAVPLEKRDVPSNITVPEPIGPSNITVPDPIVPSNITVPDPIVPSNITVPIVPTNDTIARRSFDGVVPRAAFTLRA
jgi:hypothetical protein